MAEKKGAEENAAATFSHQIAAKADKIKYFVLALLIVAVAATVIIAQQRKAAAAREAEAENKIFQTLLSIQNNPEADALPMLGKTAEELKNFPAGARAFIMEFSYAYNTRNYEAAEKAARGYLAAYPGNTMAPRASLALGQALIMQDKLGEAISILEKLVRDEAPDVYSEAKLALAQAYEMDAEKVKDGDPDDYRARLQKAEREYNDIIVRSQTPGGRLGFWPQSITLPADFALVVIKDKLAGYRHEAPRGQEGNIATPAEAIMATPPPSEDGAAQDDADVEKEEPAAPLTEETEQRGDDDAADGEETDAK